MGKPSNSNSAGSFISLCSLLATIIILATARVSIADEAADRANRPNVIIMMADDMGMGDTSAYQDLTGNSDAVQVKTPAMERLARIGIRFTDAHSPSSRCTATRAALLTGRYTWRTFLKYSVLWKPQGNPLIEPHRPTLATQFRGNGYRTAMTGKWHCGLMYRNAEGKPEQDYSKVDYRKGLDDGPLNHGFDFFHGTARSHPTSRLQGWLYGDTIPAATGALTVDASQYVLNETGTKNYEMARKFLDDHFSDDAKRKKPFFLYYACHSNHASHDPCEELQGQKVKGQSHPGGRRSDFIYENDVVLSSLMRFLENTEDPRRPEAKLIENTLLIFTSDNGAEISKKTATGPIRSNKASVYEGGHRVPFMATWKLGGIGNGDDATPGQTSDFPICHVDLFATFSEITNTPLTTDGAEDSYSILSALKGTPPDPEARLPIIHHDHKEGAPPRKSNHPTAAWLAIRRDNPSFGGKKFVGQWKLFVDEKLLLDGTASPRELYDLRSDKMEAKNRINEDGLKQLVAGLTAELQSVHDRGGLRRKRE